MCELLAAEAQIGRHVFGLTGPGSSFISLSHL